jgi:hypothetical protein
MEASPEAQRRVSGPIGVGSAGDNNSGRSAYLLTGLLKCAECGANYIMSKRNSKGRFYGYYRCSWHSNNGKNVCGNKRMLSQKKAEEAVLGVISDELLTVETIENIVEEARGLGRETHLETAEGLKLVEVDFKLVGKETANLIEAIKMTGPLEELVRELPPLRSRKSALEEEQRDVKRQAQTVAMEGLDAAFVVEVISNLKETIRRVTAVEQKALLREFVAESRVPQTGEALLMVDPVGLSRLLCLKLVTLRGVAKKVPRVEARPESICKLDLVKIDLRKRVKSTKRKV